LVDGDWDVGAHTEVDLVAMFGSCFEVDGDRLRGVVMVDSYVWVWAWV
jgi:hypothetical protein